LAATAIFSGAGHAQEHSYTPSDIEAGRGLYQANCLGCHGNTGSEVEERIWPVDVSVGPAATRN